jgi:hypothetical protein
MLTSKEYRQQARECLELAARPEEFYVRAVLLELAAELSGAADELEIKERPQADPHGAPASVRTALLNGG